MQFAKRNKNAVNQPQTHIMPCMHAINILSKENYDKKHCASACIITCLCHLIKFYRLCDDDDDVAAQRQKQCQEPSTLE